MQRWREMDLHRLVAPAWSGVLVLLIGAPWFGGGFLLSYDMVWVPNLDLVRPEVWGLGSGLPRAVPSDAVVSLAGTVLPAEVVQRIVLLGAPFLLSLGVGRLLRERPLPAQLAGATFAVWNPYVAERLVLGQWPVLVAVASFPWLIGALRSDRGPRWALVTLALLGTALSPVTGILGLVLALCVGWRSGVVRLVLLAGLVNAPWIVAGLLHASIARTDPTAVRFFELQPEGAFGRLGSALTLGGIWNTEVVPTSRTLTLTLVLGLVMAAVMLVGVVALWRDDRELLLGLAAAGAIGLLVALAGWLTPDLVARIVQHVPGGGMLRDGTRWLGLLLPLEAVAFGAGVATLCRRAELSTWAYPAAVLAILLPIAALPDLAWGVAGRLDPARYPAVWADARRVIDKTSVPGDILVLPFSSYRAPDWNDDRPVLDPAGRFFGRTTVTNDALVVSGAQIAGEDPRAARIGKILADEQDVPQRLAAEGIGIVVVDTQAATAAESVKPFADAREYKLSNGGLRVFALDGARPSTPPDSDRTIMTAAWTVTGLTILFALGSLLRSGAARLHRKPAKQHARDVPQT